MTLFSPHTALAPISQDNQSTFPPLTTGIPRLSMQTLDVTPDTHSGHLNAHTISRFVTSPPVYTSYYLFYSNGSAVDTEHVLRGGATSATNLVAPGVPYFRLSKH